MTIPIFQVDAFTSSVFGGNSAAVCPLQEWLDTNILQKIAMENAVAETVFFISKENDFEIRWFTPEIEMDLCGHATLAAAHVLYNHLNYENKTIKFHSKSGLLSVTTDKELITLNFPSRKPTKAVLPDIISKAMGKNPTEVLKERDYILVYDNEETIHDIQPNEALLNTINLDPGGIIVTAKGKRADFVSRFFTPQASIFEDPVTGSAHCSLIPYWSEKLQKESLQALQLSSRGGELSCKDEGDRVKISGKAVTYLKGEIQI